MECSRKCLIHSLSAPKLKVRAKRTKGCTTTNMLKVVSEVKSVGSPHKMKDDITASVLQRIVIVNQEPGPRLSMTRPQSRSGSASFRRAMDGHSKIQASYIAKGK